MHSTHNIFHRPSIVFKRWSRKKYAVFAGLHKHIVIGTLKASICYASMLKDGILTYLSKPQTSGILPSEDDDDIGNDIGIPLLPSASFLLPTPSLTASPLPEEPSVRNHHYFLKINSRQTLQQRESGDCFRLLCKKNHE